MTGFFDVETIAVTVLGYSMSWLELVGTLFYLVSTWLIARRRLPGWPLNLVGVLLFMLLFWQIRLYASALEQVYYVVTCLYGWWYWQRRDPDTGDILPVRYSPPAAIVTWAVVTLVATVAVALLLTRVHPWWPGLFPEPASYPWPDALAMVMSVVATWLLARKKVECWIYWIVIDFVSIGLYYIKGVQLLALLYACLLLIASHGFWHWHRTRVREGQKAADFGGCEDLG
ncbi:nicotinamide riboside transporter PnuC [Thermomonas sp.]|uniref:nicotinamide riboside transporter PnuC n=1 Tax=Thermomonas sp. TaxID=1971895 RepID=UPI002631E7E0|nr:nicotinamide riboside transporter PnuC [Thermomonas sp.]